MMQEGSVEDRAQQLITFGVPADVANSLRQRRVRRWVRRSWRYTARHVNRRWPCGGTVLSENAAAWPGLSLSATEDPFVGTDGNEAPGRRPGRRPDGGARRAGALVDGAGPGRRRFGFSLGSGNRLRDDGSSCPPHPRWFRGGEFGERRHEQLIHLRAQVGQGRGALEAGGAEDAFEHIGFRGSADGQAQAGNAVDTQFFEGLVASASA